MTWIADLATAGEKPCKGAIDWLTENNFATPQAAWEVCHRADWMFWYITWVVGLTPQRHRIIVLALCEMVRRQLHLLPPGELRPLRAVEAAEAWAKNPNDKTARAAWTARAAEAARAVVKTARAAYVALAAGEAAWAVVEPIFAASAAADVVRAAEDMPAEVQIQADILRKYLPVI